VTTTVPIANKENATRKPAHHKAPGRRSMAAQISLVICDSVLSPRINGGRETAWTSATIAPFFVLCCRERLSDSPRKGEC